MDPFVKNLEDDNEDFFYKHQLNLVGINLRRCMYKNGVNSVELHNNLGVSTGTISKIINGRCIPNLLTIYSITKYLGIKIDDLFNDPYLDNTQKFDSKNTA